MPRRSALRSITFDDAAATTRTGDIWLFRGSSRPSRVFHAIANTPVDHVAMSLVVDGLPPMLWHSEIMAMSEDVWSWDRHRGAHLHRLEDAIKAWTLRYHYRTFTRRLAVEISAEQHDAVLLAIEEFDGRRFPSKNEAMRNLILGRIRRPAPLDSVFCGELVALTYQAMGLLDDRRPVNWYDPGRFWSGERLHLAGDVLSEEIEVLPHPDWEWTEADAT